MEYAEKLRLANEKAKGKRPYFLEDKQTEQVMSITMALAMELSVANERIATLEKLLEAKGLVTRAEIDSYQPDKEEVAYRSEKTQAYLSRILRILQTDKESIENSNEPSVEEAEQILRQL